MLLTHFAGSCSRIDTQKNSRKHYFFSPVGDYLMSHEGNQSYMFEKCGKCFRLANGSFNFALSDYKEVMLPASNHFVEHHALLDLYPNCLQWNFPPKAQNWNNNQQNQQRGGCHHEASLFTFLINWVWKSAREVTSHQLEGGTPKRITREVGERGTDIACRCILLIFLLIPPMDLHPLLSLASGKVFLHGFTGLT